MAFIVGILGILQMIGGVLIALGAKSAIHEILAALAFGMGVLALGLSAVLRQLADIGAIRAAGDKQTEFFQTLLESRKAKG